MGEINISADRTIGILESDTLEKEDKKEKG